MIVLGLTGSIGMGKSTTARMFAGAGVPVHDSDETVHRLYSGIAAPAIEAAFPGVVVAGTVDRAQLGQRVLGDRDAIARLEAIVHPLVRADAERFLAHHRAAGAPLVVLDIPLLFETRGRGRVDKVVVVTAAPGIQRERVLARPGMTPQKLAAILANQIPDAEKRRHADYVIDTGLGMDHARAAVEAIVQQLAGGKVCERRALILSAPHSRAMVRPGANQMREIIFDTETTGLDPREDRVIEIGGVELDNRFPTGRTFHVFINPQGRAIHPDALAVHGISDADLMGEPAFPDIAEAFLGFIEGARLVAHNAGFDTGFLNAEFARIGLPSIGPERVVDTLALARRKHPMGPNSLDALCRRYGIDNSRRTKHGALLDSELLAEVYIELIGGKQAALVLDTIETASSRSGADLEIEIVLRTRPSPLPPRLTDVDRMAHARLVSELGEKALWLKAAGV